MRYIAILKVIYIGDYGEHRIIDSITDWSEVSDEDYRLLNNWARNNNYYIIERIDYDIVKTIEDAKKEANRKLQEQLKLQEAIERKKQALALKRKAKKEIEEKELLKTLKNKYEQRQFEGIYDKSS